MRRQFETGNEYASEDRHVSLSFVALFYFILFFSCVYEDYERTNCGGYTPCLLARLDSGRDHVLKDCELCVVMPWRLLVCLALLYFLCLRQTNSNHHWLF